MRFNDLTQTVLAVEERTGHAAASLWRQCVDILAQHDQPGTNALRQEDRVALVARLGDLRSELTEAQRIASVVELGSRLRSPALVEFFATDRPAVCAAAIARARLPDQLWPVLLSRLGPTARGVLRARRDIGRETRRALEAFGQVDLVLAASPAASNDQRVELATTGGQAPSVPPKTTSLHDVQRAEERSQIRQLVEKIERFTSTHRVRSVDGGTDAAATETDATGTLRTFPFETDAEGTLIWVGEASRTALIGLSIAEPALPAETGPDGHVAGAFARRSSFQHGRLHIAEGLYAGEWRLSGVPFFDPGSGRFQGYRGQARRPLIHEMPHPVRPDTSGRTPSFDGMRQLVHELRTPLNAILGFAEIIEQQLFGPAGVHYREMAGNILVDARRLLAAFDEIDLAARAGAEESRPEHLPPTEPVDLSAIVEQVCALYDDDPSGPPEAGNSGAESKLRIAISANLPRAGVDSVQCERMVQHLARTLVSLGKDQETVQGALWYQPDGSGGKLIVGFDRPVRLRGLEEHEMLDPGYGSDGDWPDGPLLGLGFSIRLVRSLAQAQGGGLRIESERILLELPVAAADSLADGETA